MPPDHQVGVGAQAGDVVDAAHHDVVAAELGEQLLDLARPRLARSASPSDVAQPEHRPHRVADGVVEVLGAPCPVGRFVLGHGLILPRAARPRRPGSRRPVGGGDAGRDPDPVVRRTADREAAAAAPPPRGSWRPGRGGRRRTAAGAPPHRCTCASTGRTAEPDRVGEVGQRERDQLVVGALEQLLLAVPAERAAQQHDVVGLPGRADPVPLGERERRGLDRRARRPAAPGTPSPAVVGEVAGPERQRDDGHRGVLDPGQLQGGVRRPRRTSSRAGRPRPGWRAPRRRRAAPRRRASSPTTRFQPPSAARARSRTVAPVRTSSPAAATTAAGSCPMPADQPREDRDVGRPAAVACGGRPHHRAVPVEQRHDLRHRGAGGDLAGVAGVHPAEQRLHEPVDDLAAEPLLDQPADADVLAVERGSPGAPAPARPGPGPAARQHAAVGQRPGVGGDAHQRARHRPQPPRVHRFAVVVAGCTSRRPGPTLRASATASGRRLSIDSAPTSTATPPTSATRELAADAAVRPRAPRPRRPRRAYDGRPRPRRARRCRRRPRPRAAGRRGARVRDEGSRSQVRKDLVTAASRGEPAGRRAASQAQSRRRPRPPANGRGTSWETGPVTRGFVAAGALLALRRAARGAAVGSRHTTATRRVGRGGSGECRAGADAGREAAAPGAERRRGPRPRR